MHSLKPLLLLASIIISLAIRAQSPESNDHIFPAAAAAKPFINFDEKGFLIRGKRTFLVSAGMEYARVPRALWRDRLLRLQRAGFNCVEIYTFWNFHEEEEGKFDFTGDHDLGYFLQLVKELGMYAIVRVGPYYCAEWDQGGYPLWLRFKPGVIVRQPNAEFEKYVDRFFQHLMPVVCSNQINRGGSVILVQLENEHPLAWGTSMPNEYFHHLQNAALSLGLQVPYFFSGLHHSSDPAGDGKLDDAKRTNPWLSTEFWSVWYNYYNSSVKDALTYERRTWKIIAHGGNGYNYYMAHGGTNFGYTNNDEDAASYDYGAAVGQAGDLRPIYYSFKRAALFARSFQNVLENSIDATADYQHISSDTSVRVSARHSPSGDIIFVDNPGKSTISTTIKNEAGNTDRISLMPGEIVPVVHNFTINPSVTLQWSVVRILGICRQEKTNTIVVFGDANSPVALYFSAKNNIFITKGKEDFKVGKNNIQLRTTVPSGDEPKEYIFTAGGETIRILVVTKQRADCSWFIENKDQSYVVSGPLYAGDINNTNGKITLQTEAPVLNNNTMPVYIYTANKTIQLQPKKAIAAQQDSVLNLDVWQMKNAAAAASQTYDDSKCKWLQSANPMQMGADGDLTANAWYRTKVNIDSTGDYLVSAEGGDRATFFIDGKMISSGSFNKGEVPLHIDKGAHTLAVFTAHDGRNKIFGYLGAIDSFDRKGISGNVLIKNSNNPIINITKWKFIKASDSAAVNYLPQANSSGKDYAIGEDAFNQKQGFGWFTATVQKPAAPVAQLILKFKSTDENATVFINGKKALHHNGWNSPFSITINNADTLQYPLSLSVFIENYSGEGGIDGPVTISNMGDVKSLENWHMHGGISAADTSGAWQNVTDTIEQGYPYLFRTTFAAPAYSQGGIHAIWRVQTTGLGHGSVWVNGHNLGRYPEKIPAPGMYIPECWLKENNTLLMYDEDGKTPREVSITKEEAASRILQVYVVE